MMTSTRRVVESAIDAPSRSVVEGSIDHAGDPDRRWTEIDLDAPTWVELAERIPGGPWTDEVGDESRTN